MEIDELIEKHEIETQDAMTHGELPFGHALRQVKEVIAHARYIELQRDEARACLRRACEFCAGRADPVTLGEWKRVAHFDTANKGHRGDSTAPGEAYPDAAG